MVTLLVRKWIYRHGHIQFRVSMLVIKVQYGCTVKMVAISEIVPPNSRPKRTDTVQFVAALFLLFNTFISYLLLY